MLHGVSRPLEVEALVRAPDPDTLEVEGEKTIDMRDFGLVPPRFFWLWIEPRLKVGVRVVARQVSTGG